MRVMDALTAHVVVTRILTAMMGCHVQMTSVIVVSAATRCSPAIPSVMVRVVNRPRRASPVNA